MKGELMNKLQEIFDRQRSTMEALRQADRLPEYPVDLTTKPGQRQVKELMLNMIEELMEASFTLKNRVHRISDDRSVDLDHFKEELGDALAYFVEICIFAGISSDELFKEYCRKQELVLKRIEDGY